MSHLYRIQDIYADPLHTSASGAVASTSSSGDAIRKILYNSLPCDIFHNNFFLMFHVTFASDSRYLR